jgi:hypothetical protein
MERRSLFWLSKGSEGVRRAWSGRILKHVPRWNIPGYKPKALEKATVLTDHRREAATDPIRNDTPDARKGTAVFTDGSKSGGLCGSMALEGKHRMARPGLDWVKLFASK